MSVVDASATVACTFDSISRGSYTALLYCSTTSNWFYTLEAEVAVTAADNGGRPVELVFTYN